MIRRFARLSVATTFGLLAGLAACGLLADTSSRPPPEAPPVDRTERPASGRPPTDVGGQSPYFNWMRSHTGQPVTSLSDAELVALIRRAREADTEYLEQLEVELEESDGLYDRAETSFHELDDKFQSLQAALQEAHDRERVERAAGLEEELESLEPVRDLARERFDLAIERRRLISQMLPLLQSRIAEAELMLGHALGAIGEAPPPAAEPAEPVPPPAENDTREANGPPPDEEPAAPIQLPSPFAGETLLPAQPEQPREVPQPERPVAPPTDAILRAEGQVARWEAILAQMRASLRLLEEQLTTTDRALATERSLRENAGRRVDVAEAMRALYSERFQERSLAGAPVEELEPLREALREAARVTPAALRQLRASAERVERFSHERGFVLEALATRRNDVELAQARLAEARQRFARVTNPFHPLNVTRWLVDRGPRILAILVAMILLYFALHIMGSRVVRMLAARGCRGSRDERLSRVDTVVSTFRQAATLAVVLGGTLMVLDAAGVPVAALMGGAAILGLAVAFGSQNLIKDFFQGFMILMENQYKLDDVIQVGDRIGVVERISLRITALRALDGALHFIPNGQIEAVSNLTHGWSRALFDIGVAYKEDVDRVIEVIRDECRQLGEDAEFGQLILEEVTMLGVDDFADSSVNIKFYLTTIPLKQWVVRRELLRRIKNRFDAEGIEIPFPHHSLYLRSADGGALEEALGKAFAANGLDPSRR